MRILIIRTRYSSYALATHHTHSLLTIHTLYSPYTLSTHHAHSLLTMHTLYSPYTLSTHHTHSLSQLECMHSMRAIAEENLEHFVSDAPEHRDSHLLLYPISVSASGHVTTRDDCKTFPDTSAPVLGGKSAFLPNSLTT